MCGICGKLNFDRNQPVKRSLLDEMMDLIRHRGPDGSGAYVSGPLGLGHRRLSIIDLSTGDQPMCNEDGSVWVVYNGEIYNFQELRAILKSRGHRFKSKADTEVIVHAYEEWGAEAVARFRGMFGFALWDARQELLLLARDHVGIKPLYYARTERSLVFASEMKSLLADPEVRRGVNRRAIDRFLAYQYLPGDETLMEGVHKLRPGHLLTVKDGHLSTRQYWDLTFGSSRQVKDFDETVEELQQLLHCSVKDHLISDVPVGVLLSGGVDSTGVLGFAAGQIDPPVRTFTVGFAGSECADERPYARLASERYSTEHYELTFGPEDFLRFLPQYVWHMEEPVCEPPAIALYYVAALARRSGVKVLLSGEGGDEAFGGYKTYRNLLSLERAKTVFGPARGLLRLGLHTLAYAGVDSAADYARLVGDPLHRYYRGRTATPETSFSRTRSRLYKTDSGMRSADLFDESTFGMFRSNGRRSMLDHMLYVDTKTWLPDDLLVKADKMTMAASTELRVPLLDVRILEFAASLPSTYKMKNGTTKRVLKAALQGSVPMEIVRRKKAGFPVPYESWLTNELSGFVRETLLRPNAAVREYFDQTELNTFVEQSLDRGGSPKGLFSLLVLELWHEHFFSHSNVGLAPALA